MQEMAAFVAAAAEEQRRLRAYADWRLRGNAAARMRAHRGVVDAQPCEFTRVSCGAVTPRGCREPMFQTPRRAGVGVGGGASLREARHACSARQVSPKRASWYMSARVMPKQCGEADSRYAGARQRRRAEGEIESRMVTPRKVRGVEEPAWRHPARRLICVAM